MIQKIKIQNFKCIVDEIFEFKNLTIFSGKNSIGKSTVLQSIILVSNLLRSNGLLDDVATRLSEFNYIRNCNLAQSSSNIYITSDNGDIEIENSKNKDEWTIIKNDNPNLIFESDFYYLSANRIGAEDIARYSKNKFGINGEFVFGYFDTHKDDLVNFEKQNNEDSGTVRAELTYWSKKILDLEFGYDLKTQKINNTNLSIQYYSTSLSRNISPQDVGTGVSYLLKILIIGLSCKKGDVFVVENPEIHLHPKAVANLTEFFSFLASNGVQCVVETHSEAFVTQFRLRVLKRELDRKDVVFYDKNKQNDKFEKIEINSSGYFTRENGRDYSSEFFSANDELWELV